MCKIYAYVRVSTSEKANKQDYERQKYLLEHSEFKFDAIFEEHISGGVKGNQRQEFNKMLELLDEKDIVCFTETSRFGRNYIDCFEMLDLITQEKKASVRFLSNGIVLEGGEKLNPYQWMMISQFFIQDEFLKRQIGYNTSNALKRKKEQGIILGRPVKELTEQDILLFKEYNNGTTYEQLASKHNLSLSKVFRIIKKCEKTNVLS